MDNKVKSFVKNWIEGHEPDTFIKNEFGVYLYKAGSTSLNLQVFFEELLSDYIEEQNQTESCNNCHFLNSCALRIDYNITTCEDFKKIKR